MRDVCSTTHEIIGHSHSATDEGIPLRVPRTMFQLPEDIREALVRFEIDTKLLLKEETLHYLFYWRPMRLPTIELAESLLRAIDMRASARGEISNILRVPLMFVRPKKGMELVQEAMTKLDLSPFMVKPVGCYLLATLTDSAPQPNSALTIVEPFWFFFTLDRNNVVVHFFSRNASVDDATMIMNRARIAVMSACRRVNQLTLLQELNESRYCR